MFSRYCSEYHERRGHSALRKHLRKCFLVLVNYLEELVYLFAKYQWLYLRVCHIRKFRFFLPFLTRRETISIQRWSSEPSPNADNPKDIPCLRVQLRCCGSCFQRLICLHAWALLSVSCFCKYLFLWILSPSFWTTLHSDGYQSACEKKLLAV